MRHCDEPSSSYSTVLYVIIRRELTDSASRDAGSTVCPSLRREGVGAHAEDLRVLVNEMQTGVSKFATVLCYHMCLCRASVRRRGMHAIRLRKGKVFRVLCTLAQLACYETYWQAFRSPVRYIRPTYATLCILTLYVRQPCTLRRALCLSFFNELDCFHSFNCDTSTNIMWKFHPLPSGGSQTSSFESLFDCRRHDDYCSALYNTVPTIVVHSNSHVTTKYADSNILPSYVEFPNQG